MAKKYHINVKPAPLDLDLISKFKVERGDNCINCGKCIKACIYEVHERGKDDPRKMADPIYSKCKNCFRCIQECPRGALVMSITDEFKNLGDAYWKPDMIQSIWKQAEQGSVPVSGAGYGGPFTGPGFDSLWTDMSEIVRPTRDGIHGREYISTSVDIGRKLSHLEFDREKRLVSDVPKTVDIPISIILDAVQYNCAEIVKYSIVNAAEKIDSFAIFRAEDISGEIEKHSSTVIPLLSCRNIEEYSKIVEKSRIIEIEYSEELLTGFHEIKNRIKNITDALASIRIPASIKSKDIVLTLTKAGAEIVHVVTDCHGMETTGENTRFIKDVLMSVHDTLVENSVRDEITVIGSGGIGMAEHIAKAIICGADLVAVDIPLILALGYEFYENAENMLVPPKGLEKVSKEAGTQRIVNLIGSWHSQMLEVLGAMGIKEVRRLRGETGRAIFYDTIESETFGKIFGSKE